MYDVDERRNTCLAGDGWNASGQTPYYELILYLVVRTPPSISTHTLVHNIRGVIILLYVYYELVFINNTSYSISTLEYIIMQMYPPGKSGWNHRELAKEAGSRWPIKQQQQQYHSSTMLDSNRGYTTY